MNLGYLLSIGGGVIARRNGSERFRSAEQVSLPFLLSVKPVDWAPVCPTLHAFRTKERCFNSSCDDGTGKRDGEPSGPLYACERVERFAVKTLRIGLVLVLLACAVGVQQITHVRERNRLGSELHARELELRALSQAYRSIEAEKARLLAQTEQTRAGCLAGTEIPQTTPAIVKRGNDGGRKTVLKGGGPSLHNRRPQLVEAGQPAHRGGTRG